MAIRALGENLDGPRTAVAPGKIELAQQLHERDWKPQAIADALDISRRTAYRYFLRSAYPPATEAIDDVLRREGIAPARAGEIARAIALELRRKRARFG